jgi:hypothetical protein
MHSFTAFLIPSESHQKPPADIFNPRIFQIQSQGGTALMKRARYTKGISLSLTPDQYEKIRSITDEQEISIAEWFRAMVDQVLQSDSGEQENQ